MHIRRAVADDAPCIAPLFDRYRIFYEKEPDQEGAQEFIYERLRLRESVVFLAEDDAGQAKGFVQLYPLFSSTRMQRLWLLNDLYVDKESRGFGIGRLLMQTAKQFCLDSGACGILLETAKTNAIGNHLYPSVGFVLDDAHHYYFWDAAPGK
jgi:GNAT superfamily N-acetyltransferase